MAHELDGIRGNEDCPACRAEFVGLYRTLRLQRTAECPGCGETIRIEDDTVIGKVQRLIDEEGQDPDNLSG